MSALCQKGGCEVKQSTNKLGANSRSRGAVGPQLQGTSQSSMLAENDVVGQSALGKQYGLKQGELH